jgi:hypothetical protein
MLRSVRGSADGGKRRVPPAAPGSAPACFGARNRRPPLAAVVVCEIKLLSRRRLSCLRQRGAPSWLSPRRRHGALLCESLLLGLRGERCISQHVWLVRCPLGRSAMPQLRRTGGWTSKGRAQLRLAASGVRVQPAALHRVLLLPRRGDAENVAVTFCSRGVHRLIPPTAQVHLRMAAAAQSDGRAHAAAACACVASPPPRRRHGRLGCRTHSRLSLAPSAATPRWTWTSACCARES